MPGRLVVLAVVLLLAACASRPSRAAPVRLAPVVRVTDAGAPPRTPVTDAGTTDTPHAATTTTWLDGPLRAGCCTDTHGLGPATIRAEDGGYVLRLAEDVPMHCRVELGPDGSPLDLRDCRMMSPWVVRTPKIPLRCTVTANRERCVGRYRVANLRYPDRGSDSVTLERVVDGSPAAVALDDAHRAARAAAWSDARVRLVYPGISSWSGRIRAEGGRLVMRLDALSNLQRCDVELGDDGDPRALVDCVPVRREWAPARRRSPLRCTRDEDHPGDVRCRGAFPWRDPWRTYDTPIEVVTHGDPR